MDSRRINDWLMLIANVGVVIGLGLLLFELRQNSDLMRVQITQARADAAMLSNEQLRLVELARALAGKPTLLLLDEIFAGLARDEVASLMDKIRQLARLGITIVIIEHTMQAMVRLVDRFIVLDHGSVLAQGAPDEITSNAEVISAYLGRKWADNA